METLQNKEEVEIKMSRNERRSRIRHFLKLFNEHVEKKPVINVEEIDEEKQKKNIFVMQAWATRYGVLLKMLNDLSYDFKKDSERSHKQNTEFGKQATRKLRESSTKKTEDLS